MEFPKDLKYTQDHEWARIKGTEAVCGISDFAQSELGDIVFVELPHVGDKVQQKKACAVVESVKTASDIFAPLSGKVIKVNDVVATTPAEVNHSPYTKGWLFTIEISNPDEIKKLLSAEDYSSQYAKS